MPRQGDLYRVREVPLDDLEEALNRAEGNGWDFVQTVGREYPVPQGLPAGRKVIRAIFRQRSRWFPRWSPLAP